MIIYLNTFSHFDKYKEKFNNVYFGYHLNNCSGDPIPLILYSEILSLYGLLTFIDENDFVNVPLMKTDERYVFEEEYVSMEKINNLLCNNKFCHIHSIHCGWIIIDNNENSVVDYNVSIYCKNDTVNNSYYFRHRIMNSNDYYDIYKFKKNIDDYDKIYFDNFPIYILHKYDDDDPTLFYIINNIIFMYIGYYKKLN